MTESPQTGPVDRFLAAVRTASIDTCDAWADDVTLDATVPNWRFHRRGAAAIRETYGGWFADPGSFEALRRMPVPDGEVVQGALSAVTASSSATSSQS